MYNFAPINSKHKQYEQNQVYRINAAHLDPGELRNHKHGAHHGPQAQAERRRRFHAESEYTTVSGVPEEREALYQRHEYRFGEEGGSAAGRCCGELSEQQRLCQRGAVFPMGVQPDSGQPGERLLHAWRKDCRAGGPAARHEGRGLAGHRLGS